MGRSTRQGFPTASTFAGISLVTTLPAPITAPSPICTPGRTITPPPQPTSVPDADGQGIGAAKVCRWVRLPARGQPLGQLHRMGGGIKLHIGGDQNLIPYGNGVAIHKGTVHIDRYVVAYVNIPPIVAEKRLGDGNMIAHGAQQLAQNGFLFPLLIILQAVVPLQQLAGPALHLQEYRVVAVVIFPCQAFFQFRHLSPPSGGHDLGTIIFIIQCPAGFCNGRLENPPPSP